MRFVILLFIANTINLGVDLQAMASAVNLVIPAVLSSFTALLWLFYRWRLEIFVPYVRYVFYLKWLTFGLFAYVATVFAVSYFVEEKP